jgi:hypothetical protein
VYEPPLLAANGHTTMTRAMPNERNQGELVSYTLDGTQLSQTIPAVASRTIVDVPALMPSQLSAVIAYPVPPRLAM